MITNTCVFAVAETLNPSSPYQYTIQTTQFEFKDSVKKSEPVQTMESAPATESVPQAESVTQTESPSIPVNSSSSPNYLKPQNNSDTQVYSKVNESSAPQTTGVKKTKRQIRKEKKLAVKQAKKDKKQAKKQAKLDKKQAKKQAKLDKKQAKKQKKNEENQKNVINVNNQQDKPVQKDEKGQNPVIQKQVSPSQNVNSAVPAQQQYSFAPSVVKTQTPAEQPQGRPVQNEVKTQTPAEQPQGRPVQNEVKTQTPVEQPQSRPVQNEVKTQTTSEQPQNKPVQNEVKTQTPSVQQQNKPAQNEVKTQKFSVSNNKHSRHFPNNARNYYSVPLPKGACPPPKIRPGVPVPKAARSAEQFKYDPQYDAANYQNFIQDKNRYDYLYSYHFPEQNNEGANSNTPIDKKEVMFNLLIKGIEYGSKFIK